MTFGLAIETVQFLGAVRLSVWIGAYLDRALRLLKATRDIVWLPNEAW